MSDKIESGDYVEVQDAGGKWHDAIAASGVEGTHKDGRLVHSFPVVLVTLPGDTTVIPWPAGSVRLYDVLAEEPA